MAETHRDARIQQDVRDSIKNDVRIDASGINVSVVAGNVRLYGSVPTYAEKVAVAEDASRVRGVEGLTNELTVRLVSLVGDADVELGIISSLARDSRISNSDQIDVAVSNGVVTLTGTVPTCYQKAQAVDDAWTAPGVADVNDDITVVPQFDRSDAEIATDVWDMLAADQSLDSSNVDVGAVGGTVYLRGVVPDFYQATRARNDAWSVSGVTNVVNQLAVSA